MNEVSGFPEFHDFLKATGQHWLEEIVYGPAQIREALFEQEWWHHMDTLQSKCLITTTNWWQSLPPAQQRLPGQADSDAYDGVYPSRIHLIKDTLLGLSYYCYKLLTNVLTEPLSRSNSRFNELAALNPFVAGRLFDYMSQYAVYKLKLLTNDWHNSRRSA